MCLFLSQALADVAGDFFALPWPVRTSKAVFSCLPCTHARTMEIWEVTCLCWEESDHKHLSLQKGCQEHCVFRFLCQWSLHI